VEEARHCVSQSLKYKGRCASSTNCHHVCQTEGFPSGECVTRHLVRSMCFCKKPCLPAGVVKSMRVGRRPALIWVVGSSNLLPLVDLLFHLRIRDPHISPRSLSRRLLYPCVCCCMLLLDRVSSFYCAWIIKVCGRPLRLDSCC
jgi:hypothetical protein